MCLGVRRGGYSPAGKPGAREAASDQEGIWEPPEGTEGEAESSQATLAVLRIHHGRLSAGGACEQRPCLSQQTVSRKD